MAPPQVQPPSSQGSKKRKNRVDDEEEEEDARQMTQSPKSRPPKRKAAIKARASASTATEATDDDPDYENEDEEDEQTSNKIGKKAAGSEETTGRATRANTGSGKDESKAATTRKRKPKARKPKAIQDFNMREGELPEVLGFVQFQLEPVSIAATPYTLNLNNFLKVRDKLVQTQAAAYTPLGQEPRPILSLPSRTDRRFEIVGPVEHLMDRERRAKAARTRRKTAVGVHKVNIRVCPIRDTLMADAPTIIAFGEDPIELKTPGSARTSGPLSDDICPDDQTCERLTQMVCDILNKLPKKLDQKLANQPRGSYYPDLALAELIAMQTLQADGQFDHRQLYSYFMEDYNSRYYVFKSKFQKNSVTKDEVVGVRAEYCAIGGAMSRTERYVGDSSGLFSYFAINFSHLDVTKANDVPEVPAWFAFAPEDSGQGDDEGDDAGDDEGDGEGGGEGDSTDDVATKMAKKLLSYGTFMLFGKFGSEAQQKRVWRGLATPFLKVNMTSKPGGRVKAIHAHKEMTGVVDGYAPLGMPSQIRHYTFSGVRFEASGWVKSCVENCSELIAVNAHTSSKVMIAFLYQTFHDAFVAKAGLVNALQTLYITADLVNQGLITRQHVLETYCRCRTPEDRDRFEHYCMRCNCLFGCFQLLRSDDGRLFCKQCSESGQGRWHVDEDFHIDSIPKHLKASLAELFGRDAKIQGVALDTNEVESAHKQLMLSINPAEDTWQDGYDGQRVFKQATYQEAVTNRYSNSVGIGHPLAFSVEAVFPLVMVDGVAWYHHCTNVTATTLPINRWKARQIPAIIPWWARGMQLSLAEKSGTTRDMEFWNEFDEMMDHAYIIASILPHKDELRLPAVRKLDHENLKSMMQSAVLDGQTLPKTHRLFKTRALAVSSAAISKRAKARAFQMVEEGKPDRQPFVMPTAEQINDIKAFGEDVRKSEKFNPNNLKMPLAPGGLPYFWREKYLPRDDTPEEYEKWIFQFLYRSFVTWDEDCDPNVVHEESVCTLHSLLIVQWYQNGGGLGKIFKCQMSPYVNHGTRSSFGRRDNVLPGSPMRSGMLVLYPKSLADFDDDKRTTEVMLWAMNVYTYDLPSTGNLNVFPLLKQIMADLEAVTPYYQPVDLTVKRAVIPFPTQSTRKADGKQTVWMRGSTRVYGADLSKLVPGAPAATSNEAAIAELMDDELIELNGGDEADAVGDQMEDVMDDIDDMRKS